MFSAPGRTYGNGPARAALMRFGRPRRPTLPSQVRSQLSLDRGERVLAHARLEDGGYAVATERGLWLRGSRAAGSYERRNWSGVTKVVWDAADSALVMWALGGGDSLVPVRERLRLAEPGFLPETVRERVTASIVVSRHVPLVGRRGVLVAGRRDPGGQQIRWSLTFDVGVDPDDPEVRARAEQGLAELRAQAGE